MAVTDPVPASAPRATAAQGDASTTTPASGPEPAPGSVPASGPEAAPGSKRVPGSAPTSGPEPAPVPASAPASKGARGHAWSSPSATAPEHASEHARETVALARGWRALSLLHGRIDAHLERALQSGHGLSVREYALLDVLSRQHDGDEPHLQMKEVAEAVVLSQSATTRLVTRLEDRGLLERYLCPTDRRGIYTDVTPPGLRLLGRARPTHAAALHDALAEAAKDGALAPLVTAVRTLPQP